MRWRLKNKQMKNDFLNEKNKFHMKQINIFLILFLLSFFTLATFAQVRLPKLISDGMVLQRNADVKIWGWATSNENVSVHFIDKEYTTTASQKGEWNITLTDLKPGGPYTMTIKASNTINVNDILVGDVWLCSGQSNMELSMKRVSPLYEKEIAESENSEIRYFAVPQKYDFNFPHTDFQSGKWQKTDPESVLNFSAVAYFFARELYSKYKIPVGLINASLGGSPAQAWLSEEALKAFPEYYNEAQKFKDSTYIQQIESQDRVRISDWYKQSGSNDEGYKDGKNLWKNPEVNISDWKVMKIPGYWANEGSDFLNGIIWFRKKFTVSSSFVGKPVKLNMGRIVDADSIFVNGVFVGTTSYQYPPRRYTIPAGILKEGENTIVVRVISNIGKGGFVPDKPYNIISDGEKIDLTGDWYYKPGMKMEPLTGETFIRWKPGGLYNGMISPMLNYKIKGTIWYQGESNTSNALEYQSLLPALIIDWRNKFNQGNFPFLFVQLPNYMEPLDNPSESNWALLRESQLKTLSLPNTGMAVAIDLGEWNDIHPLNKLDVGKRLALAAGKVAYGDEKTVYSGPVFQSFKMKGNKIIVTFANIGSGLIAKDGDLKHFAIAGEDKNFVWANAKIENNTVIVWSDKVSKPVAVRYAWADNPQGANLYNREGLPASPFRTDIWLSNK